VSFSGKFRAYSFSSNIFILAITLPARPDFSIVLSFIFDHVGLCSILSAFRAIGPDILVFTLSASAISSIGLFSTSSFFIVFAFKPFNSALIQLTFKLKLFVIFIAIP